MIKQLTALLLLGSTLGFAGEIPQPKTQEFLEQVPMAASPIKKGTIYLRAITDSQTRHGTDLSPGFGLGYRRSFGHSGVDVSVNYSEGSGWTGNQRLITWTTPKVSYLYYLNPFKTTSFYAGTGMGWGGTSYEIRHVETEENDTSFVGLIPHVTFGYEFLRSSILTSFLELNVSQPLIPRYFEGASKPTPLVEFSVGAGF